MLLIATDEAGYGPKLGPLVIAATLWELPGMGLEDREVHQRFAAFRQVVDCGGVAVTVGDSKVVYQPKSGLGALHAVVSASGHWCGRGCRNLPEWLAGIAAEDLPAIRQSPWLEQLDGPGLMAAEQVKHLLDCWKSSGIMLRDVQTRIITAKVFNAACRDRNKADLLSEASIGLVRQILQRCGQDEREIAVYCDRHGGRRYYAGVLQHVLPEGVLHVHAESPSCSEYRLQVDFPPNTPRQIHWSFTVKGDSFTPVALASLHAKYLRERMMQLFNAYFASRHRHSIPLQPTAGYPLDADRFLRDVEPIIRAQQIDRNDLVRSR